MKTTSVLLLVLVSAACGPENSAAAPAMAEEPEIAASEPEEPRGAPIDAPVEKEDRAQRTAEAIQLVAQGLAGMDLNDFSLIDSVPEVTREGVRPIAWRELSLRSLYGDRLRDLLARGTAPDERALEGEPAFPESVRELHGQKVAILGYMIPFEFGKTEVPEFMLVRDLAGCCFGGVAQPDEWISVTMREGGAEYVPYEPVVVTGDLAVGGFEDWAYSTGCYNIVADTVESEL